MLEELNQMVNNVEQEFEIPFSDLIEKDFSPKRD